MESKINYHALSMDEIVFDNRNKNYGAFILRKTSERNQLKALFIVGGFFLSAFLIPTLLKSLGLFAETIQKNEIIISRIFDDKIFEKIDIKRTDIKDPSKTKQIKDTKDNKVTEMVATKDTVPSEKEPEPKKRPDDLSIGAINPNPGGSVNGTPGPSGASGPSGTDHTTRGIAGPDFSGEMPEFIGGDVEFQKFVEEHLEYPDRAREDDIEGNCEIKFVVNADGSIEQISISKSTNNKYLDAAALALVKKLPKYKPGSQNGHPVRVWCIIPISFSLN